MQEVEKDTLMPTIRSAPTEVISTDICIVGGGMSGVCAAIAAARLGVQVTLIQDRAVLGGNASSEIRMWICGAHGRFNKEAGYLEEIQLLNYYRNPEMKYPIWDTVLYEAIRAESNINLQLTCSVCDVNTEGSQIKSVRAWHLTRQTWIEVSAKQFIDCSGDSILKLSGAEYRWGREDKTSHGESKGRDEADRKTMGNSLLLQLREIDPEHHIPFNPPAFARKLDDSHPRKDRFYPAGHNFWWIEIGGEQDTISNADDIRDGLYEIAYGVWDYIKNHPDGRGHRWELEWIGALPGKRENVRYVGGYTLNQLDVESQGKFKDTIAYGGWTMDDHATAAFEHDGPPTTFHPAPSPYGIPYGVLYSKNIINLMFAGRNISATHMALSSTRVMGTCSMLGQAAGTACALSVIKGITPADMAEHMDELQNRLMEQDQWLPCYTRPLPALTKQAALSGSKTHGDIETLRDGYERRLENGDHWVEVEEGGYIEFDWAEEKELHQVRFVVHTNLHDEKRLPCSYPKGGNRQTMPKNMPRNITIEIKRGEKWHIAQEIYDLHQRFVILPLATQCSGIRIRVDSAWGGEKAAFFSVEVGKPDYTEDPIYVSWPDIHQSGQRRNSA